MPVTSSDLQTPFITGPAEAPDQSTAPGTFKGISVLSPAVVGLTSGVSDRFLLGTGKGRPGGVEAHFEYNGAIFNVRQWQDTFLILSIEGLADADIRDTREINPQRHGETSFDSYYGGRTIVLTGRIRAGTLNKLRDMQQGLKQIFGDISKERPLYIRTNDSARDVFINCKKSQPIVMSETQQNFNYTRDFQITLRASDPFFMSYMEQRLVQAYQATVESFNTSAAYNGPININENPDIVNTTGYRESTTTSRRYASPTGDDTTGTGTSSAPYRTVSKLLQSLVAGEIGVLRGGTYDAGGGTYTVDVDATRTGTVLNRKKIVGYPGETPVISGRNIIRNGFGYVDFEHVTFSGGANTLVEFYGSNCTFDQCRFTNGNAAATGVLVGSLASNWAVTNLKFTRCLFENIGPVGTSASNHAIHFDNTDWDDVTRSVEVSNCVFRGMQGGYTIQLYRAPNGVWIHHNVFYNNYRGMHIGADDTAVARRRAENNLIEYNIFHTTTAAVSPFGYHFAHSMTPSPGSTLGNVLQHNTLYLPAHDPDNNGGIQLASGGFTLIRTSDLDGGVNDFDQLSSTGGSATVSNEQFYTDTHSVKCTVPNGASGANFARAIHNLNGADAIGIGAQRRWVFAIRLASGFYSAHDAYTTHWRIDTFVNDDSSSRPDAERQHLALACYSNDVWKLERQSQASPTDIGFNMLGDLGTGAAFIPENTWVVFDLRVTLSDVDGSAYTELRKDGVVIGSTTLKNFYTGKPNYNRARYGITSMGSVTGALTVYIDQAEYYSGASSAPESQGFTINNNQESDPGFVDAAAGNFESPGDRGLLITMGTYGASGTHPKTPLSLIWANNSYKLQSVSDAYIEHLRNDGLRYSITTGQTVAVRARVAMNATILHNAVPTSSTISTVSQAGLKVNFYDSGGVLVRTDTIFTTTSNATTLDFIGTSAAAPSNATHFDIHVFFTTKKDQALAPFPEYEMTLERMLITLDATLGSVPLYFDGDDGGQWLGTANASQSQMMSETGLDKYDLYSSFYTSDTSLPDVYVLSGRLRNFENGWTFRFLRKNAPSAASISQSINYYTGAQVQRTNGYTGIVLKWIDDKNYIYARVDYTNSPAVIGFFKVVDGVQSQMGSTSAISSELVPGLGYTLNGSTSGNDLQVTHSRDNGTETATRSYTLTGDEITKFGSNVIGRVGFSISQASMDDWQWDAHTIDVVLSADIVAFTATNEGNAMARTSLHITGPLNASTNNGPALKITARYTDAQDNEHVSSIQINAYGGTTVAIPDGHYLVVDSFSRTIKEYDENDVFIRNAYEQLDITSEWLELGPNGDTIFEMQTYAASRPTLEMIYRHTFL